jgi:hypothetical protein
MWPVKSVGITDNPTPAASSNTDTRRRIIVMSTVGPSGWNASHVMKIRIESNPARAILSKSAATDAGSNAVHQPIAVVAGQ